MHSQRSLMRRYGYALFILGALLFSPGLTWAKGGHSGYHASSTRASSHAHASGAHHTRSAQASTHHARPHAYSATPHGSLPGRTSTAGTTFSTAATAGNTSSPASAKHSGSARGAPPHAGPAVPNHGKGYVNSRGEWVPSPTHTADGKPPRGATAHCSDGSYSFSRSHRGTCSHHGGVASWLD